MTLPYIDLLLGHLARGNPQLEQSFGRHIHWGYWPHPGLARPDCPADYAAAAERLSLELLDLAAVAPGMRLLDTGCGFGGTLACLDEARQPLDLLGLNIDPRQLARAAGLARPRPGNTIAFVAGDACALPFADASFDRVMAVECVFHFPSRAAFLAEVRRVLRPGGALVLSDFVPAPAWVPVTRLARAPWFDRLNLFGACDVTCSAAAYRRLAAAAGLSLTVLRDITRQTLPTYAFLGLMLQASGARGVAARWGRAGLAMLDLVGRTGLLRYSLLRFDRA